MHVPRGEHSWAPDGSPRGVQCCGGRGCMPAHWCVWQPRPGWSPGAYLGGRWEGRSHRACVSISPASGKERPSEEGFVFDDVTQSATKLS